MWRTPSGAHSDHMFGNYDITKALTDDHHRDLERLVSRRRSARAARQANRHRATARRARS
jgi:hypothetical protein